MMKKRILSISVTLCLALLSGCACQAEVTTTADLAAGTSQETSSAEAPQTTAVPETTAALETTAAARGVTVSIETLTDEENIHITYPVLSGIPDASQETFWNDFFLEDARSMAADPEDGTVLTCTWLVTSGSARILSLVKKTELSAPGAAHPTVSLESYNIDSQTGKAMRLSQLCDTNAIAADLAGADDTAAQGSTDTVFTVFAPDGTDITGQVTLKDLLQAGSRFTSAPDSSDTKTALTRLLNHMDYDGQNEVSGYTYWKEGVLHLVFPYTHAAGDYVDILVKDAHRNNTAK